MNATNNFRLGQYKQIVISLEVFGMIGKAFPTKIRLLQRMGLYHRSQCAIQKQNALGKLLL